MADNKDKKGEYTTTPANWLYDLDGRGLINPSIVSDGADTNDATWADGRGPFFPGVNKNTTNVNPRHVKGKPQNRDYSKDGERELSILDKEYMDKEPAEEGYLDEKQLFDSHRTYFREFADQAMRPEVEPIGSDEALKYDSSADQELSNGLDTLNHTHQLPPETSEDELFAHVPAALSESTKALWYKFLSNMTEAGGKAMLIDEYLQQAQSPSLPDFEKWAKKKGQPISISGAYFKKLLATHGGRSSSAPEAEETSEMPAEPFDVSKAPKELKQLIDLYAKASDEEASVAPTVEQKYDAIYSVAYRTAKGRALKKHAFICGSAGIGKTFTIVRAVEKGATEAGRTFAKYRGSIGKSLSDILAFLYLHQSDFIILLDDCDGFLTDSSIDVINTLKAAMDTDEPLVSTGGPGMRKIVAKKVGVLGESTRSVAPALRIDLSRLNEGIVQAFDKNNTLILSESIDAEEIQWYKTVYGLTEKKTSVQKYLSTVTMHEAWEEESDDEVVLEDEPEEERYVDTGDVDDDGEAAEFPHNFMFKSGIVFVSNMMQSEIPEAIAGRCNIKELFLTRREIMVRIEQILPELLKNETAYSKEEMDWAKKNVFKWMTAVVVAEEMHAPLATSSGASVQIAINVPITFRMFNDFVDGWMTLADSLSAKAGKKLDQLEKEVTLRFISQIMIPAFRGDMRSKKKR